MAPRVRREPWLGYYGRRLAPPPSIFVDLYGPLLTPVRKVAPRVPRARVWTYYGRRRTTVQPWTPALVPPKSPAPRRTSKYRAPEVWRGLYGRRRTAPPGRAFVLTVFSDLSWLFAIKRRRQQVARARFHAQPRQPYLRRKALPPLLGVFPVDYPTLKVNTKYGMMTVAGALNVRRITSNDNLDPLDQMVLLDCTSNNVELTLPEVTDGWEEKWVRVMRIDASGFSGTVDSASDINSSASAITIPSLEERLFFADGGEWWSPTN